MRLKDRLNRFLDEIEEETKTTPERPSTSPTSFQQELQKEIRQSASAAESSFANIDLREEQEHFEKTDVSIIDYDARVFGNISTNESLCVNGEVIGNIVCEKNLELNGNVEGDIRAGNLQVKNCVVRGNISCDDSVSIDAKSELIGDCWNENISLKGIIKGSIYSRGKIHLHSTAEVMGNVSGTNIVIDDGATIQGNIKIKRA